MTHGYDWSVLKGLYGQVLGSCGEVVIGNNCIIGANSLVNHDIPDGWVAAGNPAKPIMPIDAYYQKRIDAQLLEAKELYRCYVQRMHKEPPVEVFDEFFWLFHYPREEKTLTSGAKTKLRLVGNYDYSLNKFLNSNPIFYGYEEFLKYMRNESV